MIAYYNISAFVTLCIIELIHDVEDYVVFYISNNDTGEHSHKTKSRVRYTVKGAPYFMHKVHRIYLDECMRVKI